MRRLLRRHATALGALLAAVLLLASCSRAPEPMRESREALGTVVAITAYGPDEEAMRASADAAYAAMDAVEAELDAHDPGSEIGRINAAEDPSLVALPLRARAVLDAVRDLEVREWFSPQLWAATDAWAFEEGGRVPAPADLEAALADPRWDFGGAAKGLALHEAATALRADGTVGAALLSSGSTTLAFGEKPDGEPWRIGIEDPRDTQAVIATVEATGDITVSTSGDYQRYFERDGVRYHHILDPATGLPARGLRSLTVVGDIPGLDSDILSTALFVAGPDAAVAYAEEYGLGLVLVDDGGRTRIVPGPEGASWRIAETGS
ncbi:MAG: FAD:protein FMN transferase [Coriobacteriia bacterium]|nr:FAD:protein FMN transferase [Coriobacteriia bacterium]